MGAELHGPIVTEQARCAGFTNERGVAGTTRFHKNLVGLWLVQEVRRDLERRGTRLDYAQLTDAAATAEPFRTRIDAAHAPLAAPGDIMDKLAAFARGVGDPEPQTPGQLVRCCLEALAAAYRRCLEQLELLLARRIEVIQIVGGGSKNVLLCQMTADSTGRRVIAGPAEATAAGNVLVQAWADDASECITDLASLRSVIARSFDVVEYTPRQTAQWEAALRRHRELWESEA
jgi:rhamnulokinase